MGGAGAAGGGVRGRRGRPRPRDLRRTVEAIVWRHGNGAAWRAIPASAAPPGGGPPSSSSGGPSSGPGSGCSRPRKRAASSSAWRSWTGRASGRIPRPRARPKKGDRRPAGPAGSARAVARGVRHQGVRHRRRAGPSGRFRARPRPSARAAARAGAARPAPERAALGRGRPRLQRRRVPGADLEQGGAARDPDPEQRGGRGSPLTSSTTTATCVERLWGRLKEWRAVATRYEKTAASYLGVLRLAATMDRRSRSGRPAPRPRRSGSSGRGRARLLVADLGRLRRRLPRVPASSPRRSGRRIDVRGPWPSSSVNDIAPLRRGVFSQGDQAAAMNDQLRPRCLTLRRYFAACLDRACADHGARGVRERPDGGGTRSPRCCGRRA